MFQLLMPCPFKNVKFKKDMKMATVMVLFHEFESDQKVST